MSDYMLIGKLRSSTIAYDSLNKFHARLQVHSGTIVQKLNYWEYIKKCDSGKKILMHYPDNNSHLYLEYPVGYEDNIAVSVEISTDNGKNFETLIWHWYYGGFRTSSIEIDAYSKFHNRNSVLILGCTTMIGHCDYHYGIDNGKLVVADSQHEVYEKNMYRGLTLGQFLEVDQKIIVVD